MIEAAEAIPLDPQRLDPVAASSRGLGLWIARYRDCPLVMALGGTATMDAGAGLLEVLDRLPGPTRVLCSNDTGSQHDALAHGLVDDALRVRPIQRITPCRTTDAGVSLPRVDDDEVGAMHRRLVGRPAQHGARDRRADDADNDPADRLQQAATKDDHRHGQTSPP